MLSIMMFILTQQSNRIIGDQSKLLILNLKNSNRLNKTRNNNDQRSTVQLDKLMNNMKEF
jgi:hypothetical protein